MQDDEEEGEDEDEDDGFFVPHGYLSEDEGVTEVRQLCVPELPFLCSELLMSILARLSSLTLQEPCVAQGTPGKAEFKKLFFVDFIFPLAWV